MDKMERPRCGVMRTRNVSEYMLVLALCLVIIVMLALWNRAYHYILILFLSFFLSFFLLLFFPRLTSAVGDWMFTILRHMVWP